MKSFSFTALLLCAGLASASALANEPAKVQNKASTPRLADGKPDLNGIWVRDGLGGDAFGSGKREAGGSVCILCPPDPPPAAAAAAAPNPQAAAAARARMAPERPKYKPEFEAKVKDLDARQVEEDPALRCGNPGLPRIGAPDGIVQTPGQIVFLYNDLHGAAFRIIPTDGRAHNKLAEESYLGDSVGKWEGDTLIVEAVKFIEDTWLIDDGAFHTPDLKVVERLQLINGKLEYQATAHDPAVLAEPWQMRKRTLKRSDKPMNEPLPCIDRDIDHVVDGTHHDNAR